jgi:hypothetical protein
MLELKLMPSVYVIVGLLDLLVIVLVLVVVVVGIVLQATSKP